MLFMRAQSLTASEWFSLANFTNKASVKPWYCFHASTTIDNVEDETVSVDISVTYNEKKRAFRCLYFKHLLSFGYSQIQNGFLIQVDGYALNIQISSKLQSSCLYCDLVSVIRYLVSAIRSFVLCSDTVFV